MLHIFVVVVADAIDGDLKSLSLLFIEGPAYGFNRINGEVSRIFEKLLDILKFLMTGFCNKV